MTKKLVMPSSKSVIEELIDKCDGLIVGIDNFSVNMSLYLSLDEINELNLKIKANGKKLFVAVNKNIHDNELNDLEKLLIELDNIGIDGILYYDVSIVNLKRKLNLKTDLVWAQEHLTTNYATCNFWNSFGVDYAYLSSDITLDEILTIKKNTSMKLFVTVFGYLPMFASYRHLVSNYLDTFNLKNFGNNYKISKEGNDYLIVDNSLGSFVYSKNILNGIDEALILINNDIDYIIINGFQINDGDFVKTVNLFANLNEHNVTDLSSQIYNMFENCDKGFLYKETVYKVKNNE